MKSYLKIVPFLFLFNYSVLAEVVDWNHPQINRVQRETLKGQPKRGYSVPLDIVVFRDSSFTAHEIREQLKEVQKVYSQCDLSFSPVNLYMLEDEGIELYKYESEHPQYFVNFKRSIPLETSNKIALFTVKGFVDERGPSGGFTRADWRESRGFNPDPEAFNTAWILDLVKTPAYKKRVNGRFNIFAHELLHILTRNMRHLHPSLNSLLATDSGGTRTNEILDSTCKVILENTDLVKRVPLIKRILK